MSVQTLNFSAVTITGIDAEKFLQGQLTINVLKLLESQQMPTAICDLKGRIAIGLWIEKQAADRFLLICESSQLLALQGHLKKFGAFSKITISTDQPAYPILMDSKPSFSLQEQAVDAIAWQSAAFQLGNYMISQTTAGLFQPQELRLHQRGGVDFDKGCYLGQEIVARLWFKAAPKAWLHCITGIGETPPAGEMLAEHVQVVNSVNTTAGQWMGLVVARPNELSTLQDVSIVPMAAGLNDGVERQP